MLSPADSAIVARDPGLPGLALILDAEALAARLGRGPLTSTYLRYKPGTSCVGSFLAHGHDGSATPFAVMVYTPERFGIVRGRSEWRRGPDPAVMLDDACTAVVPASKDRDLKALRRLCDPDRYRKYLRHLFGRGQATGTAALEVLRYKPNRRFVARIDREGRPPALLKTHAAGGFAQALAGASACAALGGQPLMATDFGGRTLALAWIEGEPLCPTAARQPDLEGFGRTGARLARLHAAPFVPPVRRTRAADVEKLGEVVPALEALCPELAPAAAGLVRHVTHGLRRSAFTERLTHGDFSADQVILRDGVPTIIDWDQAAAGDPAHDLGCFLARLDAQAIDGVLTRSRAEAAQKAFLDGYAARRGLPDGCRLHHVRALLALAAEGFRLRMPDWVARTERVLDRADALLSTSGRQHRASA